MHTLLMQGSQKAEEPEFNSCLCDHLCVILQYAFLDISITPESKW